ncbi:MAG: type II secretion system protein, partial [Planctomycetota bacterium]
MTDSAPAAATRRRVTRHGFTLVELLVSAALVSLIMLLLSQAFATVSETITTQKGIAANDRRARLLDTTIRGDLNTRTFRDVIPFWPGQDTTTPGTEVNPRTGHAYTSADFEFGGRRSGYFSISENDPLDPTDDVLQFTIDVDGVTVAEGERTTALTGRVQELENGESATDSDGNGTIDRPIIEGETGNEDDDGADDEPYINTDQPFFDSGFPVGVSGGTSTMAEVSYFLREGNLYRSVWLIREPYDPLSSDGQPSSISAGGPGVASPLNSGSANANYGFGSGEFWRDFDYSAVYDESPRLSGGVNRILFHTAASLSNSTVAASGVPVVEIGGRVDIPFSLGVPHLRFGAWLDPDTTPDPNTNSGAPREFVEANAYESDADFNGGTLTATSRPTEFIGRYTKQEASSADFGYPGRDVSATAAPFNRTFPGGIDELSDMTSVYATGARQEVDLLLPGVREFDIKVFDDDLATPAFVDLGNGSGNGFYDAAYDATESGFGGSIVSTSDHRLRYDTWHPALADFSLPATGSTPFAAVGHPPFAPFDIDADANGDGLSVGDRDDVPGADDDG